MWVLMGDAGTVQCSGLQGDCKGSAQVVMQPHSVGCEANFVKDKSLPRGFPAHIWLGRKIGLYGSLVGQEISFVHSVCETVCCRWEREREREKENNLECREGQDQPLAAGRKLLLSSWIQLLIPPLPSILRLWRVGSPSFFLSLCLCLYLFTLLLCPARLLIFHHFLFPHCFVPHVVQFHPFTYSWFPLEWWRVSEQVRAAHLPVSGSSGLPGVMGTPCGWVVCVSDSE